MKIAEIMKLHTMQWDNQKPSKEKVKANTAPTFAKDTITNLIKQTKKR